MCERKDAEEYRERTLCGGLGLEGSWSKWIPGTPEKCLMNREYQYRKRNDLKMKCAVDPAEPGAEMALCAARCPACGYVDNIGIQVGENKTLIRYWSCGECGHNNKLDLTGGEENVEDAE